MTIDSIFKNSYPELEISSSVNKISKKNEFELNYKALAKKNESFYSYKASGRMAYHGHTCSIQKLNLAFTQYSELSLYIPNIPLSP